MPVKFVKHNDGTHEIELCEISYADGRVTVFPATERDTDKSTPGHAVTFAESYPAEYAAFKDIGRVKVKLIIPPPPKTKAKPPKARKAAVKAKARKSK